MKATKLRAAKPWVLVMLLVFLSCLFGSGAQAQGTTQVKEVALTKGKTVSHIALELTRDAKNWRKPEIKVYRVVKGERILIGKSRYSKLLIGDIVSVPMSMVVTREVEFQGRTISEFCAEYKEANCVRSVKAINSLSNDAATQKLHRTIYVPTAFTRIEKPAVQAAAPTTPTVAVFPPVSREEKEASTSWIQQTLSKRAVWMVLLALLFTLGLWFLVFKPSGSRLGSRISDWWSSHRTRLNRRNAKKLEEFLNDFKRRLHEMYGPDVREEFVIRGGNKSIHWEPTESGLTRTEIVKTLRIHYASMYLIEHWKPVRKHGVLTPVQKLVLEIPDLKGWDLTKVSFPERHFREKQMVEFAGKFIAVFQEVHTNSLNRSAVKYVPEPIPEKRLLALRIKVDLRRGPQVLSNFRENVEQAVKELLTKVGDPLFVFDRCTGAPNQINLTFQYLENRHVR